MVMTDTELGGYDDEQVQMMKENCIVVDENDTIQSAADDIVDFTETNPFGMP